jgi:outer membrane immunogenic protein
MKKLLVATILLGVSATAVLAADMSPMAYDWTGLYAGVNGGYAFSGSDSVGIVGRGPVGDLTLHGMFGGVQLGYNHQINNIVLGVETDFQGGDIHDSLSGIASDRIDWFGTLRGRAGFAADRALIYATGGLAYGGGTYKEFVPPAKDNYSRIGWTLGAGVEYAVSDSMSVKAEYLYTNFGRFTVGATQATPDFHSVRLGVNFKF